MKAKLVYHIMQYVTDGSIEKNVEGPPGMGLGVRYRKINWRRVDQIAQRNSMKCQSERGWGLPGKE
jgi:hypothetical protein